MTFEEAVAAPGRKVQIPRTDVEDGQRVLEIYEISGGGAKRTAFRYVPVGELDALVADLKSHGLAIAENDVFSDVVWIRSPDGIEVYNKDHRIFEATGHRATLVDDRVVERSDIASVFSWASDGYTHRGIKATLRSGEEVELVTEISFAATGDPTYNRNDLLYDSGWCTTLGSAIAQWAGTTYEDKI